MATEEMNDRPAPVFPEFSYSYEGICDNAFLITFTEYLTGAFERVMTPQEFKIVLFCANELLQNMGFYSADRDSVTESGAAGRGKFSLAGTTSEITMISENLVAGAQYTRLAEKLDSYNTLTTDELKALYKQKIREQSPDDSKGGGIGFIEIIRKSKSPIRYSAREEDGKKYITLQITLRRMKNDE